jgi:hypothetical protein
MAHTTSQDVLHNTTVEKSRKLPKKGIGCTETAIFEGTWIRERSQNSTNNQPSLIFNKNTPNDMI